MGKEEVGVEAEEEVGVGVEVEESSLNQIKWRCLLLVNSHLFLLSRMVNRK